MVKKSDLTPVTSPSSANISDNVPMVYFPHKYYKKPNKNTENLQNKSKFEIRKYLCVEHKYDRLLFKYKTCCKTHLESYILDSSLYMSDHTQLNDPFELKSKVKFDYGKINVNTFFQNLIVNHRLNFKQKKQLKKRLADPQYVEDEIKKSLKNNFEQTGIHSFAKSGKNLLMWAQYADKHQGLCLIFEVSEDIDTFIAALPVNYSDKYPVIEYHHDISGLDLIKKSFLTKSLEWKNEDERRIFDLKKAKNYLVFKPKSLFGIILGAKITEANKEMVYSLLRKRKEIGKPDVKVFEAFCSDSEYKLKIWQNKRIY